MLALLGGFAPMILGLFKDPTKLVMMALAAAVMYFVWQYDSRGNQIAELKGANKTISLRLQGRETQLRAVKANLKLRENELEVLSEHQIDATAGLVAQCKAFFGIDDADEDPLGTILEKLKKDEDNVTP